MLHSLYFSIDGVLGPGGSIDARRSEILKQAVSLAKTGLELLGDWANDADWFDGAGLPVDAWSLFETEDEDELQDAVSQVSDAMKTQGTGFIDVKQHGDLFALIEHHYMSEWVSQPLRDRIADVKHAYWSLASDLSDEWGAT